MDKWYYSYAGLIVYSTIELPEWEALSTPKHPDKFDVEIVSHIATIPFESEPQQTVTPDEYSFLLPRIGRYRITGGTKIKVEYLADIDPRKLRLFLLGSAWGALCYQRGMLAVHAGSVQIGNSAILLCAGAGKGKSTLTASLAVRGHALISDDLCCLEIPDARHPVVHPSTQRLRLWSSALHALGMDCSSYERDFYRIDKYLVPWPYNRPLQLVPLKAIYLLEWGELRLARLTGAEALQRFASAATYREELLHQMGKSGHYWQQCLELLAKVPTWVLTRPQNLARLDTVAELLENHNL